MKQILVILIILLLSLVSSAQISTGKIYIRKTKEVSDLESHLLIQRLWFCLQKYLSQFQRILRDKRKEASDHWRVWCDLQREFDTFLDYINNQFKIISVTYSQTVDQFSKYTYTINKQKFKKSDL